VDDQALIRVLRLGQCSSKALMYAQERTSGVSLKVSTGKARKRLDYGPEYALQIWSVGDTEQLKSGRRCAAVKSALVKS
jgi:hypothetical protein